MTPVDRIRAALEWTCNPESDATKGALAALAELEAEVATLRARLVEIDAAPTVAYVEGSADGNTKFILWSGGEGRDACSVGTEMIARPEAK